MLSKCETTALLGTFAITAASTLQCKYAISGKHPLPFKPMIPVSHLATQLTGVCGHMWYMRAPQELEQQPFT